MTADFTPFGDVERTLEQSGPIATTFSVETLNVDTSKVATLDYLVTPAGTCVYQWDVNGTVIHGPVTLNTNNPRTMSENLDGGLLVDGVNQLTVTLVGVGNDDMGISDGKLSFKTLI
jgi:hypothetical protein